MGEAKGTRQYAVVVDDGTNSGDDPVICLTNDYKQAVAEAEEHVRDLKGDYPESNHVVGIYQLIAKTTASLTAQTKAVPR